MAKAFNINNADVVQLTNRLEKMHKSAMPVSVRGALNDAAFDMKKHQIERVFVSEFIIRRKTFIKSQTAFNRSKNTFNIRQMSSEAGIVNSDIGKELEIQEKGGTLQGRSAIVTDKARISQNLKRRVSSTFFLNKLKGKGVVFKNKRRRIVATKKAIIQYVKGKNRFDVLYRFRTSTEYNATHFIEKAGELSAKKIPEFFIKQAKRRLNK